MNKKIFCFAAAAFFLASLSLSAEVSLKFTGSTGIAMDGLKGYLGGSDVKERIVVRTDEPQAFLMFFWDSKTLALSLTVTDKSGKRVAELDLAKGNILTLSKPGEYICTLTAKQGSGHWLCVVLGSREWDP